VKSSLVNPAFEGFAEELDKVRRAAEKESKEFENRVHIRLDLSYDEIIEVVNLLRRLRTVEEIVPG